MLTFATIVAAALFLALAGAITWFGYRSYARAARVYDHLSGPAAVLMPESDGPAQGSVPDLPVRIIETVGEKVPISPQDATDLRRDLIAAGYRTDRALTIFLGIRVIVTVLLVLAAFMLRSQMSSSALGLVFCGIAAMTGWFAPGFILERLATGRNDRIRCALPDALDLMVVSVEAGLALDQAIQYVARELKRTHKDLSDEFGLVTLEMRAGKRRSEALRDLSERTAEPELRKLVAILIQTDKFGTSISESLRTHSEFMRVRRRQAAEERAAKVGVKLVFPIFFFILPSMFVLAAGPSMLAISKNLLPALRGGN